MPHKPVKFRETEMARAIRAARKEGLPVERVEITNDGVVILHTGKVEIANIEDAARQQWQRATEEITKPPPEKTNQRR
jgi:hypothetical protein